MVSFDRILAALESLLSFIFTIRTMAKEAFDTGYKILFDTDVLLIMMRKKSNLCPINQAQMFDMF